MSAQINEFIAPAVGIIATLVSISVIVISRGRWFTAHVRSISEQNEFSNQMRTLQNDNAFYEERLTSALRQPRR